MSDDPVIDEFSADEEVMSRELWDRIIAYDESLATGQALDLRNDETIRGLPKSAREQVHEVLECLEILAQFRSQPLRADPAADRQQVKKNELETRDWPAGPAPSAPGLVAAPILKVGRFEVLHEIGSGGHGIVFLAHDPLLNRRVAIKTPRPEFLLSKAMRARFVAEARAVAALDHANIVKVLDAGFDGAVCYIAMELCEGANLAQWLRQGKEPVDAETAARLVMPLAEALHHAHQQGILHRDLKPANVLLKVQNRDPTDDAAPGFSDAIAAVCDASNPVLPFVPKLADFGICKAFDEDDQTITRTGVVVGTAAYMAPEQAASNAAGFGPYTDVYGLGAILYEVLTGAPPIQGDSLPDVLRRVLTDEPAPIRGTRRDVPAELEAICLKCLDKSTGERYATAAELADDLSRFLEGKPVRARRVGRVSRMTKAVRSLQRSTLILISLVLSGWLLVLAALGMYVRSFNESPGGRIGLKSTDPEAELISDLRGAFNSWYENAAHLRENSNAADEMVGALSRHIPQAGQVDRRGFAWNYLWRLCHPAEAVGTLNRVLSFKAHTSDAYYVTFSRDGSRLATAGRDRVAHVWDAATGKEICVCTGHRDDVNWVDISPDQRLLATASDDHTVKVWDAATGKEKFTLAGHASEVIAVLFSPTTNTLVSGDRQGILKLWDLSSRRVLKSVAAHHDRIQSLAWSAGGHFLASTADDSRILVWEMPGMLFRSEHGSVGTKSASFSPDGDLLAAGSSGTINIEDVQTGGRRATFSNHLEHLESLQFSPDGQQIASCDSDGSLRLWDRPTHQGWLAAPIRHQASKTPKPVVVGLWCVAYSPDGTRLATSSRDGVVDIWDTSVTPQWTVMKKIRVGRATTSMVYSPDGKRLVIGDTGRQPPAGSLETWDVNSAHPSLIQRTTSERTFCYCRFPDGKEYAAGATGGVDIFDAGTGKQRARFRTTARAWVVGLGFDERGHLWAGDRFPTMKSMLFEFDAQTGAKLREIVDPFLDLGQICDDGFAISSDGKLLAICTNGAADAGIYDLDTGKIRPNRIGHRGRTGGVRFQPHGPLLALSVSGGVEIWDMRISGEIGLLPGLGAVPGPFEFTSDGRFLIVVSKDQKTVVLWSVEQRKQVFTLPFPAEMAARSHDWHLAVNPNGRQIACSIQDNTGGATVFLLSGLDNAPEIATGNVVTDRSAKASP